MLDFQLSLLTIIPHPNPTFHLGPDSREYIRREVELLLLTEISDCSAPSVVGSYYLAVCYKQKVATQKICRIVRSVFGCSDAGNSHRLSFFRFSRDKA